MKNIFFAAFLAVLISPAYAAVGIECDVKAGVIKSAKNEKGFYATLITVTEIVSARYTKMPCPVMKGQPPYQDLIELDRHYMPGTRLDLTVVYISGQSTDGKRLESSMWKVKK